MSAGLNLAQRGVEVTLIERDATLGGRARDLCCKAIKTCQLCGGCLYSECLDAVKTASLDVRVHTTVTRIGRENGGFSVFLAGEDAPGPLYADALILATGYDPVDAHTKGPYGYGILPTVITGEEMEKRLHQEGQGAFDGLTGRVAFIQCVGSRDEHVGRGYCSQVCCRYALRLARLLKARRPELEITVFKMDIQTHGRDFAPAWNAALQDGIRIVAGLPAVIRRSPQDPTKAVFLYDDILAGKTVQEEFDLVALSIGMQPRRDAAQVAEMFGLNLGPYGFFSTLDDEASTIAPGVFVAGSCQAPRSIAESIAHARQAAEACYAYLQERGS